MIGAIRCSWPEWIWERWQWRGTLHFPKLHHYWNLTIRLYSVISGHLLGWGPNHFAEKQLVYSTATSDWAMMFVKLSVYSLFFFFSLFFNFIYLFITYLQVWLLSIIMFLLSQMIFTSDDIFLSKLIYCCIALTVRSFVISIYICLTLPSVSSHLLTSLQLFLPSLCLFSGRSNVFFVLPSFFLFADEEWKLDHHFLCTFYLLFTDDISSLSVWPQRGVREQDGTFDRSVWVILTNRLTYSYFWAALITWLKPSNQNRSLRQTLCLTAIHITGWTSCIFPSRILLNSSGSNLNVIHVKNRSYPSAIWWW